MLYLCIHLNSVHMLVLHIDLGYDASSVYLCIYLNVIRYHNILTYNKNNVLTIPRLDYCYQYPDRPFSD